MKKNLVVILIIAHKSELNEFEKVSLSQCFKVLGSYPIKLICPEGLDVSSYKNIIHDIDIDFIDPKWQANYRAFNRLKIDPFLYRRYIDSEYVLFYELDAFVFRDELTYWCSQNYDYIGAPWFEGFDKATEFSPYVGVGNGGFSLRRVDAALKALHRFSLIKKPEAFQEVWELKGKPLRGLMSLVKNYTISNNSFYLFNDFRGNEDEFWAVYINKNFDWFNVASLEQAMKFSFEANPKLLFKKNNNSLPFGCHGWWKYDLNFWLPHIQSLGYLQNLSI